MSREEGSLNCQNSNSGRRVSEANVSNNNSSSNGLNSSEQVAAVSNVTSVVRNVQPPNVRIAEDAKQALLEGVSEFISLITVEAIDHHSNTNLRSQDVLDAMERLGLDPNTLFLHSYRRAQAARDGEPTSTVSSSGQAAGGSGGGGGGGPGGVPSLEPHPQREGNNGADHFRVT